MLYKFTRDELKNKSARQFNEGDVIKVGKYYIHIRYGEYNVPLKTTVNTEDDIRDLTLHKQPKYIHDFKSRLLEELA